MTLTLLFVGTLYAGYVLGWTAKYVVDGPMFRRLKADAARWQYVRNNADIVGETQEGVWSWQFEAPDVHLDSFDADVDAAIEAYEQRQEV